jgi:phage FluMu protein Com
LTVKREIKCPYCKQWTLWNGNINDRCQHCGVFLEKEAFSNEVEKKIKKQVELENDPLIIQVDDSATVKATKRALVFLRKMLYYFQIAFVAFISFILWLISLLTA